VTASKATISYDAVAARYARHRDRQNFVVENLNRLRAKSPDAPILEIGCGTGVYASAMAQANAGGVYAMDLSRQMLRHAPTRSTQLLQARASQLPFADESLAMVFSVNVIHHLKNIGAYFQEAFRVLKSGGILCTATDSRAIIERRRPLSHYWPATIPIELARYHPVERLRREMTAARFVRAGECEGRSEFSISDIDAYQDKAYSCLQLIAEEDFARGLTAMASDLRHGPLKGASELVFLWAERG
jgi:ubiquinone/menaquinone biosynthesis C-methylase UbiE